MAYVDGFVLAVPRSNLDAYRQVAQTAAEVWREYGALAVVEAVGDDVPLGERTSFPRAVQAKEDEVVVFSWILHASRQARDETNARVMKDPRMACTPETMPFDGKRLIFGGFETLVEA
ncbi:DUF1428 domain-containing protein [Methylobacterium sp. B4]|uniref:DUF1428 domain-containing protein n=1 Tax=Methylobacterium sp. B4 TaxID=1938755 RepID=UPI000D758E24|nr:DUF1428 domain-containing protein [Methylobacterium sp. B4]PXW66544.1 uncharacterized protein YbaA (DUF1428 family) [Methylobacterium sp. B4]